MKKITSTITNVTVFKDRAQVYRIATVEIDKGEQLLRFENLPYSIEKKSIQLNGKGNALLKNIKFKEVYHEKVTDENKKNLLDEAEKIKLEIIKINSKLENTNKEKSFIERIAEKVVEPESKSKQELNPENWLKMLEFYRTKLNQTDKEIFDTNILLKNEATKLDKINKELIQAGRGNSKKTNVIDVIVVAEEKCEIKLYLSYVVYGASWFPNYNARVSSEEKELLLEYNSTIIQNTGENWENIGIKLSTAQVQVGGDLPVLNPWNIDIYRYIPPAPVRAKGGFKKSKKRGLAKESKMDSFSAFEEDADEIMMKTHAPIRTPNVTIEENVTSSIFIPQGKYTILSDNLEYNVSILQEEFDAEFDYTTVPKLSPYAYLKAKTKNTSDFPLLPGLINIFFNNNFVAESKLKLVLPSEEFILSLGVDESIKVEYKPLPKYNKNEGIFTKKNVQFFEYETIITNTKKTEEKISVIDNIPVSQDEKIKVSLIKPKYKEDTDEMKLTTTGILTRLLVLEPESKNELELRFEVEFPKDETVTGL